MVRVLLILVEILIALAPIAAAIAFGSMNKNKKAA